jgi:hypothetical protein
MHKRQAELHRYALVALAVAMLALADLAARLRACARACTHAVVARRYWRLGGWWTEGTELADRGSDVGGDDALGDGGGLEAAEEDDDRPICRICHGHVTSRTRPLLPRRRIVHARWLACISTAARAPARLNAPALVSLVDAMAIAGRVVRCVQLSSRSALVRRGARGHAAGRRRG